MSAATLTPPGTAAPARAGVPWTRLVGVELRKQVDTRAGRWLLALVVLVDVALVALYLWAADEAPGWSALTEASSAGQLLLLPLIGVLAATSEWSQRTALTTFALEPRRTRVHGAKAAAGIVLALGITVATLAVAAVATLVGGALHDGAGSWSLDGALLGGLALALVLLVLQGLGFGLALLSTPAAIVAYLALPTVWSLVSALVPALRDPADWLDMSGPLTGLMSGSLTGDGWAQLGTSTLLWVGVPLAVGLWRTARRDVA
ncbi:ABC transporter permease [Cellulomonas triticagri]|uniref:ABC transporter permease n=1 Tax=Cellulomonas triticagri TaxID=2483352 RepID=A0A3M2J752_9CELL|nr:ABC transporter permease [Cellulomonas triticagri]RMI08694.1 ABC transporter permease [Cellulomonas triticagri]